MSAKATLLRLIQILSAWLASFAVWIVWESSIRIFIFHEAWTPDSALSYIVANFIFSQIFAFLIGILYFIVASFFRAREYDRAVSTPLALTFLVMIPVFLRVRLLVSESKIRYMEIAGILLVLSLICFWILHLIFSRFKRGGAKFICGMLLVPLILILGVQWFRDHRFETLQNKKGGVRQIILVSIDTLRYDFVHAYGITDVKTPVMDRISAEGVLFENAISPIPQTGPSHISMLTGKPPLVHGVLANGQSIAPNMRTLAHELRESGFRTAAFISGYPLKIPNSGLDPAFQVYDDRLAFIDRFESVYLGKLASLLPIFDFGVYRLAQEVTDSATQWLSQNSDHPFFLFLHYYDPHYPYGIKPERRHTPRPMWVSTPSSDVEKQRQLYAKEVESVDSQLHRVIDLLKARGIYDRTLLIVTADHGESLGEHNYFYDHKGYVYEQLLRVPLMIRWPKKVKSQQKFKPQVGLFDIYNTILQAAGIPKKQPYAYDLIELSSSSPENYSRKIVSFNYNYNIRSVRTDEWKLIETKKKNRLSYELYDLPSDPQETKNLYQEKKDIAAQLLKDMQNLIAEQSGVRQNQQNLTPEQMEGLRSLGYLNE